MNGTALRMLARVLWVEAFKQASGVGVSLWIKDGDMGYLVCHLRLMAAHVP